MSKKVSLKDAFVRSGSAESAPPPSPAVARAYESGEPQEAEAVDTATNTPVQPVIQPPVSLAAHPSGSPSIQPAGSLYTQPPVSLGSQQTSHPPIHKKKATFNLNAALHQRLKIAAAIHSREMVDIVEDALQAYLPALDQKAG